MCKCGRTLGKLFLEILEKLTKRGLTDVFGLVQWAEQLRGSGQGGACSASVTTHLVKKSLPVLEASVVATPQFKGFTTFGRRLFISMFHQGGLNDG